MIKNTLITKITFYDKDTNGNLLTDRNGKRFKKVVIQTDSQPEQLSKLIFGPEDEVLKWKEGEYHSIIAEKNEKGYWNFRVPTKFDALEERVAKLEQIVKHQEEKGEVEGDLINRTQGGNPELNELSW